MRPASSFITGQQLQKLQKQKQQYQHNKNKANAVWSEDGNVDKVELEDKERIRRARDDMIRLL